MKYSIGIDIGGMSIKAGLVDDNGCITEKKVVKTVRSAEEDVNNIVALVNSLLSAAELTENDVNGIGIGCPGAVNGKTGMVDILPNLGWENVPLGKKLKDHFSVPIKISNDANVAALAEAIYGAAKGLENVIMLTLGTGVGGGIIINEKIYEGKDCKGAELGHATLVMDGYPCTCGRNGCIECYVSATALIRQTKEAMIENEFSGMWKYCNGEINNVNGKTAFDCAKQGDAAAIKVVSDYVKYLSESLMSMMNIFRPDIIILGGGVSGQGAYLIDKIHAYCEKFHYGYKGGPKPVIKCAKLGNDAGIIGAAALLNQ